MSAVIIHQISHLIARIVFHQPVNIFFQKIEPKYHQYCGYINGDTTRHLDNAVVKINGDSLEFTLTELGIVKDDSVLLPIVDIKTAFIKKYHNFLLDSIYTFSDSNFNTTQHSTIQFNKDYIIYNSIIYEKIRYGSYNANIKIDTTNISWIGKFYKEIDKNTASKITNKTKWSAFSNL